MSDRLATIDMGRKLGGGSAPFWGGCSWVGYPSITMSPGHRHLESGSNQPFGHIGHGPKIGRELCPFGEGELGPHLTQCGRGRVLSPSQVSYWSIQPFGHNTPTFRQDRQPDNGPVA